MGLPDMFKLEKLTIEAYDKPERSTPPKSTFQAMYNPTSLKQSFAIAWSKNAGENASAVPATYKYSKPTKLEFDLILDGTGVEQMGITTGIQMLGGLGGSKTVQDRINDFLDATYNYHGDLHQPYFLRVKWGVPEAFDCRLSSLDVSYTKFNRDGTALRAELKISLISDAATLESVEKAEAAESADVTHSRMVRAGDTLPLMTSRIYGSADYYVDVARFNGINDFRNISPGTQLQFPPLAMLLGGR